jgi:hypothetical protein
LVDQTAKMAYLGFRAQAWMLRPSAALVADYERVAGLRLPPAYRRFLLRFGGYYGSAYCPFCELAPYEDPVGVYSFLGFWPPRPDPSWDIRHDAWVRTWAPPVFAPIALGADGSCLVAIKCSGSDVGQVYLFDEIGLAEVPDDEVERSAASIPAHLQHLYASKKRYYARRRAGRLPPKPADEIIHAPSGLKVFLFRLASSFEEFLTALQRPEERLGGPPTPPTRGRTRRARPLNRLYRLLHEAAGRRFAIEFDRRRRVVWVTRGPQRAGVGEEEDGRVGVCYLSSDVDLRNELCTPEEAVALIEGIMSRTRLYYVPKPAAECAKDSKGCQTHEDRLLDPRSSEDLPDQRADYHPVLRQWPAKGLPATRFEGSSNPAGGPVPVHGGERHPDR